MAKNIYSKEHFEAMRLMNVILTKKLGGKVSVTEEDFNAALEDIKVFSSKKNADGNLILTIKDGDK